MHALAPGHHLNTTASQVQSRVESFRVWGYGGSTCRVEALPVAAPIPHVPSHYHIPSGLAAQLCGLLALRGPAPRAQPDAWLHGQAGPIVLPRECCLLVVAQSLHQASRQRPAIMARPAGDRRVCSNLTPGHQGARLCWEDQEGSEPPHHPEKRLPGTLPVGGRPGRV